MPRAGSVEYTRSMATAQPGIFSLGTRTHLHLEFDVADVGQLPDAVRRARCRLPDRRGERGRRDRTLDLGRTGGPGQLPTGLGDFEQIGGPDGFTMPATQHGLWLWFHGGSNDAVFDLGRIAVAELEGCASVASEQWSFVYGASQDLTGFEDGTGGPPSTWR